MKAIASPGARKPEVTLTLYRLQAALRSDCAGIEHRMRVVECRNHFGRIRWCEWVEGDHHRGGERQRLQPVDQVTDSDWPRTQRVGADGQIIPRGPGAAPLWQQRGIGMQIGDVGLIWNRSEHAALGGGRLVNQSRRLIRVAGEHDFIETLGAAGALHQHASRAAAHLRDRRVKTDVGEPSGDAPHILASAANHREPLRPVGDLKQAVVMAKLDEGGKWIVEHGGGRARPDRTRHRQQIPVSKRLAVTVLNQPCAERDFTAPTIVRHQI